MNKDMINRLKTAAGYQKKAILALLPESTAGHLEVIGKELKLMLAEMAVKGIAESAKSEKAGPAQAEGTDRPKGVKKVDIG